VFLSHVFPEIEIRTYFCDVSSAMEISSVCLGVGSLTERDMIYIRVCFQQRRRGSFQTALLVAPDLLARCHIEKLKGGDYSSVTNLDMLRLHAVMILFRACTRDRDVFICLL